MPEHMPADAGHMPEDAVNGVVVEGKVSLSSEEWRCDSEWVCNGKRLKKLQ